MAKKQTKADKAFIDKIGTIGINTSGKKAEKPCPGCGGSAEQIGYIAGEIHGQMVGGPVYGHAKPPGTRLAPAPVPDEQSFSA